MAGKLKEKLKNSNRWFLVSLALIIGIFFYGGSSLALKATDQAAFCSSCHVMNEQTRTYLESTHANVSCNECHAPQQAGTKIFFKAKAGLNHVAKNVSGDIPDVIHAIEDSKAVVNQNCVNCHTMTNINVAMDAKEYCTDCHRQVPHGRKNPIGERMVAGE